MRLFNLFYLVLAALGVAFFFFMKSTTSEVLSFYGFAESNETEINYNYPVVVDKILVTPGQEVKAGQTILQLSRIKAKETLSDEPFRIAELRSEAQLWDQRKKDEIARERQIRQQGLDEIEDEIVALQKELKFKGSLVEGLQTLEPAAASEYHPIKDKIARLEDQKKVVIQTAELKIKAINNELALGKNPYAAQVKRLNAELAFEESHQVQEITVTAPGDGLVGSLFCKEAEHIPSYKTLMSFYEPHSGIIKGYVHEDLTMEVNLGTNFKVTSLKDETIAYDGKVIGLGSRIVEIPMRLRKMPDLKTYGREILVEITKENSFLQKEKVALSYINGH